MMLEGALELLISPAWRELSVGRQTLGQWVAGHETRPGRCPFSQPVELRFGPGLAPLLPELQVRADAMSFELWERLGLPLHSRAKVLIGEELQPLGHSTLWEGDLLLNGYAAQGECPALLIQEVAKSLVANGARLLGPKQLHEWLRLLAKRHPKLVSVARRGIKREELHWVLLALLDERASIRRLDVILSVLLEQPVSPLEAVRLALAGDIVSAFAPEFLNVITMVPKIELETMGGNFRSFFALLEREMERFPGRQDLVLVCQIHDLRFRLRKAVRESHPDLVVMSWREVVLGGVAVNCVARLETLVERRRFDLSIVRDQRRRLRLKENQQEFLDRLLAESEARARAPFV